jgi:hypothetical protein
MGYDGGARIANLKGWSIMASVHAGQLEVVGSGRWAILHLPAALFSGCLKWGKCFC